MPCPRTAIVQDALLDQLVAERRRHVGNRAHDDVATIATRGAGRRGVETETQPARSAQRDGIRGVEILAHLQAGHTVRAVEMVHDLAELVIVEPPGS